MIWHAFLQDRRSDNSYWWVPALISRSLALTSMDPWTLVSVARARLIPVLAWVSAPDPYRSPSSRMARSLLLGILVLLISPWRATTATGRWIRRRSAA